MVTNVILKMSIIQLLLIFQLFFYVNGANQIFSSSTIESDNNMGSSVNDSSNRIIGGAPTNIKQYPFMVSIQWRYESIHRCGGTYVLPHFILTAAHCVTRSHDYRWYVDNPYLMIAIAGSTSLRFSPSWQIRNINLIMAHARYNPITMAHDIALLRIAKPFRITAYISLVSLPMKYDQDLVENHLNEKCIVLGWGKTSTTSGSNKPKPLQYAEIPLMPSSECKKYPGYHHVGKDQICAGYEGGGIDACQGDSGGPLLCDGVQVGVVSWGLGCAEPEAPGVYNRIDVHLVWINRTILRSNANSLISNYLFIIISLMVSWKVNNNIVNY